MENKPTEETVYRSNYMIILVGIVVLFGIFLAEIYYFHSAFPRNPLTYLFLLLMLSPVVYYKYNIYISLSKDRLVLHSLRLFLLAKDKIPLSSINMVRRVKPNYLSAFGDSYITFYSIDGSYKAIHEGYFEISIIKDFLTNLKSMKPWAEFDAQYEDLIAGKIPCDESFRQLVPKHTEFFTDEIFDKFFS